MILVASGMFLFAWYKLSHQPDTHNLQDRVSKVCNNYMKMSKSPGLAVGIIQGNKMYIECFGYQDRSTKVPVDSTTIFEIGSITKVFTAEIGQILVDRGVIDWKQTIYKVLPDNQAPSLDDGTRLFNLATHTSGYPRLPKFFLDSMVDPCDPYPGISEFDYWSYVRSPKEKEKPSVWAYEYSNVGFSVLGDVLEYKSKREYEVLLQEEICKPLLMKNTNLLITDSLRFATGYDEDGLKTCHWNFPVMYACGAIRSNLSDMMKFLNAQLRVSDNVSKSFAKTHTESVSFAFGGIGKAWNIDSFSARLTGSGDLIWHNGGTGGFSSYIGFLPEKQTGIVVLTNQYNPEIDRIALKMLLDAGKVSFE